MFDGAAHVPIATLPGHARAHADDLVRRQDVQHHRLEDRLDLRPGGAGHRGADGQAVPHLRQRRPVPAGDRRRARPARRVLRRARRRPAGQARPPRRRPASPPGSTSFVPEARTSSPSTSARSNPTATAWRSAARCPSAAASSAIPNEVFYARTERPAPRALRLLQAPRGARRGGRRDWRRWRDAMIRRCASPRSSTTSCGAIATPTSPTSPR